MKTIPTAILLSVLALLSSSASANTYTLVSLSGDSPDAEETLTYESFSTPRINELGQVAFGARFEEGSAEGASRFDAALIFDNGIASILVNSGQETTITGSPETFANVRGIAMTNDSDIAFIGSFETETEIEILLSASLRGEPAAPTIELHVTNFQQPVADFEGNLDSSRRHQLLGNPSKLNAHAFSFISRLRTGDTPDATGYWIADLPASETDPLPALRLAALEGLAPKGDTLVIDKPLSLSLNSSLEGALLAILSDEDEIENNNGQALWHLDATSASTRIAQTGDTAPGSTETFLSFGKPAIDESGNVVFWASLLNDSEDEGLYRFSSDIVSAIATTAAPIEVFGIERSYSSFTDPVVNEDGDLAVLATLANEEGHAILVRSANGAWSIVAQTDMLAPGTFGGVTFETLSFPHINGAGQVAFQASLAGSGDAISNTTDSGMWALDSNGVLSLILREGDTFEVKPGFPATVEAMEIGGFNASGKLALRSSFTNGASAIATIEVGIVPPPSIAEQPASESSFDGETVVFSVEAEGQGPFQYQWKKDDLAIEGATNSSLAIANASSSNDGAYSVTITSTAGSVASAAASLSVQSLPGAPVFVEQPLGDIALLGTNAILDARAVSTSTVSYQWYFEGEALPGKTSNILSINPARAENEGAYHVIATSEGGSTTSASSEILVTDKRLINISARSRVGSGANVLIAGFVVIGPEPKQVLIRGIGPGLPESLDRLLAPRLELYNSASELIHSNNRWGDSVDPDAIAEASLKTGAGAGKPLQPNDTAMLVELEQGLYTAIVSSQNETSGIALVEAFEVSDNLTRMTNVSARAFIGIGDEVVIPGFVVDGDLPSRVLIRAIGPGLKKQDVAGVLEFPEITVYDAKGQPIAHNDGWGNLWDSTEINAASALVGAKPLDEGSEDAALILELEPGLYTVISRGENNTTGVALIEVFAIP